MADSRSRIEGFAAGVACTSAILAASYGISCWYNLTARKIAKEERMKLTSEADDKFHSLFYGPETEVAAGGAGFPISSHPPHSVQSTCVSDHKKVQPDYRRLPSEFYKFAVEHMPIVCVDVVLQRPSDGKVLLFYRKDKPAANIWWWPGGRMFRGETFEDTALRKVRDETGAGAAASICEARVVNVWNTFFPDSCWDQDRKPEHYGTQTVNITVFCRLRDGDLQLDSEAARRDWAVEAHKWVHAREVLADPSGFDKYVSLNIMRCVELGLLSSQ